MAWIIKDKKQMAHMLDQAVCDLESYKPAMLILPLLELKSDNDLLMLLLKQRKLKLGIKQHRDGRTGTLHLAEKKSVMDVLYEISIGRLATSAWVNAAFDCQIPPNTTDHDGVPVTTHHGSVLVDPEAFAKKTGLPLKSNNNVKYAAFTYTTPQTNNHYLVAIPEDKRPPIIQTDTQDDSVAALLTHLKERSLLDKPCYHTFPEIADGWQLKEHPQFNSILPLIRRGYSLTLEYQKGVLTLMY